MPTTEHTEEREERKLTVILYFGTIMLMLVLLYASYANMRRYDAAVKQVKRYNNALLEIDNVLIDLQNMETSVRGFLLSNDSTYLEPYRRSMNNAEHHLTVADSLLPEDTWRSQLGSLRWAQVNVADRLKTLVHSKVADSALVLLPLEDLGRSKAAMDAFREVHAHVTASARSERAQYLRTENTDWLDAPIMVVLYSILAIAATALLFWRLSKALTRTEIAKLELQQKLTELDKEVAARSAVQDMLQKVLDISPNGIMTLRAIRDGADEIVDLQFLTLNKVAIKAAGREDLQGKYLLKEHPVSDLEGRFDIYAEVVRSKIPVRNEFPFMGPNGEVWYENHVVPFEDGIMVTFSDITEKKRLQDLSTEAERLNLTGQITRTVAHEVRNPLTNIHLALEQLGDEVEREDENIKPFFDIIGRNLDRIGNLIKGMLESSKERVLDLNSCRMEDLVQDMVAQVKDRLKLKEMRCEVFLDEDLFHVDADRELINLALTNIAVNAIEAMEPGIGILTVRAKQAGGGLVLEITDNGKGIAAAEIERLFQPFYSSRSGGLGLGLTTTRSILHGHGIKLQVRSELGKGSTFLLRFPKRALSDGVN